MVQCSVFPGFRNSLIANCLLRNWQFPSYYARACKFHQSLHYFCINSQIIAILYYNDPSPQYKKRTHNFNQSPHIYRIISFSQATRHQTLFLGSTCLWQIGQNHCILPCKKNNQNCCHKILEGLVIPFWWSTQPAEIYWTLPLNNQTNLNPDLSPLTFYLDLSKAL